MRWSIFGVFVVYFMLAIVIPLVQILASSFFPIFGIYNLEHLTLDNWRSVFNDRRAMNGLKNTVLFSTAAAAATVVIGGLIVSFHFRQTVSHVKLQAGVQAAVGFYGVDHIMFASDHPFWDWEDSLSAVDVFTGADRDAVLGGNAKRTLRLGV